MNDVVQIKIMIYTCKSDFAESLKKHQKEIREKVEFQGKIPCGQPVLIPVAVHFNGNVNASNTNCLLDKCLEQIDVLIQDFCSYNSDISNYNPLTGSCPSIYPISALSTGTCLEFCLASSNHPSCASGLFGEYAITVGQHSWPSAGGCWSEYVNIFVEDGIGGLGVAPLFGALNPNGNGFLVEAGAFG